MLFAVTDSIHRCRDVHPATTRRTRRDRHRSTCDVERGIRLAEDRALQMSAALSPATRRKKSFDVASLLTRSAR